MSFASRRGKPERSTSSIVAHNAAGYHDLKIDGSSLTNGVPTGPFIKSLPFTVGGHRWRITFYPDGKGAESRGYVSLFLDLDEDVAKELKVQLQFTAMVEKRDMFFIKRKKKAISTIRSVVTFDSHGNRGWSKFSKRETLRELVSPRDGHLTIRCDIVIFNKFRAESAAPKADLIPVPPAELHKHLGDLLQSGRGADVVFEAGGETFRAHRCVLAARSPVISAELLAGGAGDGDAAVAVRVEGVEAPVFRALLRFAYTDALPEMKKEEEDDIDMYQKLFVAADRYSLLRLKLICANKLCELIDAATVKNILALAEQHHCDGLKKSCLKFLSAPANLRAAVGSHGL